MSKSREELKNSMLYSKSTVETKTDENVLLEWRIKSYTQLKQNVLYYTEEANAKFYWTLGLKRVNKIIFLAMKTNAIKKKVFFNICNRDGNVVKSSSQCEEICDGCYVAKFCEKSICNPKSTFLNKGELLIQCKCVLDSHSKSKTPDDEQVRFPVDVDELSNDLKKLYDNNYAPDFILKAQGEQYRVHKLVLITRCDFFMDFFKKYGVDQAEYEIHAPSNIVHHVLMFVYTGKLTKDLDVNSIKEVLLVARRLGICSLENRCLDVLEKSISMNNVRDMILIAVKSGCFRLLESLFNFVKEHVGKMPNNDVSQIQQSSQTEQINGM